jgi:hypothetical protein
VVICVFFCFFAHTVNYGSFAGFGQIKKGNFSLTGIVVSGIVLSEIVR